MVAAKLGYNYYGVDLSEKQVKANEKQAFDMADKLGNRY
jgi:hypothetical protein